MYMYILSFKLTVKLPVIRFYTFRPTFVSPLHNNLLLRNLEVKKARGSFSTQGNPIKLYQ